MHRFHVCTMFALDATLYPHFIGLARGNGCSLIDHYKMDIVLSSRSVDTRTLLITKQSRTKKSKQHCELFAWLWSFAYCVLCLAQWKTLLNLGHDTDFVCDRWTLRKRMSFWTNVWTKRFGCIAINICFWDSFCDSFYGRGHIGK